MAKKYLVYVVGIVVLLIILGGASFLYFQYIKKPSQPSQPPTTAPVVVTPEELKNVYQLLAMSKKQLQNLGEESIKKVDWLKQKLYQDCLSRSNDVKNFILKNRDGENLENVANLTKSRAIFECLNTNQETFKVCQQEKSSIVINANPAEDMAASNTYKPQGEISALKKNFSLGEELGNYVMCEAAKTGSKTVCSQMVNSLTGLIQGTLADASTSVGFAKWNEDCQNIVGRTNFITSVFRKNINCQNLCTKDKVDIDSEFTIKECQTVCQAIQSKDTSQCQNLADKNDQLYCNVFITSDSSYCQQLEPKILEFSRIDGGVEKRDQVADCENMSIYYKAVKEDNADVLKEVKDPSITKDYTDFFQKFYFGSDTCNSKFDNIYGTYCKIKYLE